jgi:hypothetical protein
LRQLTEKPESWSNLAIEAEEMPFPKPDITPPVIKINFEELFGRRAKSLEPVSERSCSRFSGTVL